MAHYFNKLNYTMGDEDATPEMYLLPLNSPYVMAVADCGSRVIPLLARHPQKLTCVDINPSQLAVCMMRLALLKQCPLEQFMAFIGYQKSMTSIERKMLFHQLVLDQKYKSILEEMFENIQWNCMLYLGQFERMLQLISKINRMMTGKKGTDIFTFDRLEEQVAYYKSNFPLKRWRLLIALLGNSTALNSLLYKGDFPIKNRHDSHYAVYWRIFNGLFTNILAKRSFFLQMLFFGEIKYREGLLIECDPEVYSAAQSALKGCELSFIEGDVFETANKAEAISFLSLSDVPSFLPPEDETNFLRKIKLGLSIGGLAVVRAHLRVPFPHMEGFFDISHANSSLETQESTGLWTFHIYQNQ